MSFFPSKTFPKKHFAGRFFPVPLGGFDAPVVPITILDLRSNLLYDFRFNEFQIPISGITANSVATTYTGAFLGLGATSTPSGYLGRGIYCRGNNTDDHINIGIANDLNFVTGFSILTRVKFFSFRDYDAVFSHYRDVNKRFEVHLGGAGVGNNSGLNVYCGLNTTTGFRSDMYIPSVLLLNTWYTIGSVFNGTGITNNDKLKLYLNGVNQTGVTFTLSITGVTIFPDIQSNQNAMLSMRNTSAIDANSIIDNVKIFNRALTSDEMFLLSQEQNTDNFSVNII